MKRLNASPRARSMQGFTLVEILISLTIGLILIGGVVAVYTNSRHAFTRDDTILTMQDDARQALREIVDDLSMAGFWSDLSSPDSITLDPTLSVASDCGPVGVANWIYRPLQPGNTDSLAVAHVDNATTSTAAASFSCIGSDLLPGTDIVAIRRVKGAEAPAVLSAGTVYLRSNGTLGLLFKEPVAAPAITVPAPFRSWEYRAAIYYIRNFALTAGDGIPTLCRKVLRWAATPTIATECLAQGIEDLQIEYGLDTNSDGTADSYVTNPTAAQMARAVAAQVYLLARSSRDDVRYTNDKSFTISNSGAYVPNDNFYRRVYSISVVLHNLRSMQMLGG